MNICICQLIKDEQRYIEEWIEYYINLGISKFILVEDWNSTSHKEILNKYGDKIILHKLLDILPHQKIWRLRQRIVWEYFFKIYKNDFDGCLFIDPDEYLIVDKQNFLEEINIANDNHYKFIYYQWQIMSANGHIKDPYPNQKYSVVNTYTYPGTPMVNLKNNGKLLILLNNVNSCLEFNVPHGVTNKNLRYYYISPYKLNHYLTKSFDEFFYRLYIKGEQTKANYNRKIGDFFYINPDLNQYKDELLNKCSYFEYKYNKLKLENNS